MKCNECNGHLYGCPYEDYDISECDEGKTLTRMTELAYSKGREDAIAEFLNLIIANQEIYDCTAESGDILIEDVKKLAEQMKGENG